MKKRNAPMWSGLAIASLGCFLALTCSPGILKAAVVPGPDDTICTAMGFGCRDERNLVDTCRHTPQEGCHLGASCIVYYLDIGAHVCWACINGARPVPPWQCYCAGTPIVVQSRSGGDGCQNDQSMCYCRYNEQMPPEDIGFYSCSPALSVCA